jgi:hypothetical protein
MSVRNPTVLDGYSMPERPGVQKGIVALHPVQRTGELEMIRRVKRLDNAVDFGMR